MNSNRAMGETVSLVRHYAYNTITFGMLLLRVFVVRYIIPNVIALLRAFMPIIMIIKNIQWKYSGSSLLFLLVTGWDIRISARLNPLSPNYFGNIQVQGPSLQVFSGVFSNIPDLHGLGVGRSMRELPLPPPSCTPWEDNDWSLTNLLNKKEPHFDPDSFYLAYTD